MVLAHGSPEIELVALTTCGGQSDVGEGYPESLVGGDRHRADGCAHRGGCTRPLVRAAEVAESIHGDVGM